MERKEHCFCKEKQFSYGLSMWRNIGRFLSWSTCPHSNVKMEFFHVLQKQKEDLRITYGIVLEGAEAKKWGEIIGTELSKDMPTAVSRLVHLYGGVIK
ncbi:hypothetical protein [Bacillus subtilis]|uniref:hypothetical protein n=1 Tax=Bacillus subtilis TaxID=1423 RepID=UPI0009B14AF7|nr:hypothetical protein [Bacillus subtilis]